MKISRKSEYALLALVKISASYSESKPMSLTELVDDTNIPAKYLEQIFYQLKLSGIITTLRGKSGGYLLKKSPNEISVADIVRALDGPLAAVSSASEHFYEKSPIENNKQILALFKEVRDLVSQKLESTYLSDLT